MITIQNDRLVVKMADPNKEYNTCRFNRAAFIFSAVLDGETEFCGDEHGGTEGYGLCSEIKCDPLSDVVKIGEKFPKYGVGLLTKTEDEPYMFMKRYEVEENAISVTKKADEATFYTAPRPYMGYALAEKKTVSLHDNVIRIDYEITNAGEKELDYSEYVHNFLTLEYEGRMLSYNLTMQASNATDPYSYTLLMGPRKVVGRDYFIPWYHNIWSPGFVISPEVFCHYVLQPGETVTYAREYELTKLNFPKKK